MAHSSNKQRLLSLDILRGITISGMILVNNPGSWSSVYAPLRHAEWNGLTPTDLVFPFFMFIMGVSMFISLKKFDFKPTGVTIRKIVKRTIVIFLIGIGIAWLSLSIRNYRRLESEELGFFTRLIKAVSNIENLRILGVLQRLALSYGFAALIVVLVKHKWLPYLITGGLLGYFLILVFGNGFVLSEDNIISVIDRALFGVKHLYTDSGVKLDPEGLLSTLPSICHVLIGFLCGKVIITAQDNSERMLKLFTIGACLTFSGFLLAYGCPINKKIWSPTFVLVCCGLASTLLSLLILLIDVKQKKRWSVFFESFGVNPLFCYVLAALLSIILGNIRFAYGDGQVSVLGFVYQGIMKPAFGNYLGSLAYAIFFVLLNWSIGHILYKKRIYIKI
ncbi:MAG: heparan-alpha-glucosaminide N-acetyltransferase domain-containing protein [Dysgonamonadaceae bacterium]|jgi:predicted acyltransferase|nr:heparan-alpha-glucosaminide N-acetyltransferase domain-containing protein [Dysgonamonadaceae bacterium]